MSLAPDVVAGLSSRSLTKTLCRRPSSEGQIGNLCDELKPGPMDLRQGQWAAEALLLRRPLGKVIDAMESG